jgi:Holliday junction resolvase
VSLHRRAPRRDLNEGPIVDALRKIGCRVIQHSGAGEPDLFVHWSGDWVALEVKQAKGKLTKAQQVDTRGVQVVRSLDEALGALGFIRQRTR